MLKKLLACVGEYKKASLLAPFYVTFEVILEVIIPLLMAHIIDEGIEKNNMSAVLLTGAVLLVLVGFSLTCGALSGKYAAIASAGFAKNLRKKMFYNVQDFSFSNIDKFSTSGLVTRLTTDVAHLQMAYQMIIRIAVRSPVMLISSLVAALLVNPKISLVFLAVTPFLAGGLLLITSKAHPIFEKVFRTYDRLNNVVQENLHGIRVVKAFVREDHETEKFRSVSKDIYSYFSRAEKLLAFNAPIMQFSMYTCLLMIAWLGAKFIVAETMTQGELVGMITYAMQILMSLMSFSMIFVMITISRASAERIAEVLSEKSELSDGEENLTEVSDGSVVYKNVSFSYSQSTSALCLKNINIQINSGETIGIIGGTGSAKTTLIQLIPRLYDATEGEVLVGGQDVRKYNLTALRNAVSVVLQKNELFSGTIKENLRWGNPTATDDEIVAACRLAQADEFIRSFPDGYDTHIEQGGKNVSGGQKQRLCIARALLKKPKILILDDSTSAVDTRTDRLIRQAFKEKIPHTTQIIIAQRISSIEHADRVIVMENGEVNAFDTPENLLKTNHIYSEIYESQQKGAADNE